jgi:hypothetical protein
VIEPDFQRFVARAFALLADELPRAWSEVGGQLAGRSVAVRVGGRTFYLVSSASRLRIVFECAAPQVWFGASSASMCDLASGRLSLLEGVMTGALELRGAIEDLVAFHDALVGFVRAAMRCPALLELRDEFLRADAGRPATTARVTLGGGCHV